MSTQSQVPKNFQRPKQIRSYGQYLKAAGEASGILPIQPEADSPSAAPGPSAGAVQTHGKPPVLAHGRASRRAMLPLHGCVRLQ